MSLTAATFWLHSVQEDRENCCSLPLLMGIYSEEDSMCCVNGHPLISNILVSVSCNAHSLHSGILVE